MYKRPPYINVPVEFAQFCLRERKVTEGKIYLCCHFLYPGKVSVSRDVYIDIAAFCDTSVRTVYDKLKWLKDRNWIGKDEKRDWMFIRGINRVHKMEGFKYSRCGLMVRNDFQHFKSFLIGTVLASIVITGNTGSGTDRLSRRSGPTRFPVSLFTIKKALNVSEKTAYNYRKLAQKYGYIKMVSNLQQVVGITPKDVWIIKQNEINKIELKLFGSTEIITVKSKKLRTDRGYVYIQNSNIITPKVKLKKRKLNR